MKLDKLDILGLVRAYLVIPAWWCLYLGRLGVFRGFL